MLKITFVCILFWHRHRHNPDQTTLYESAHRFSFYIKCICLGEQSIKDDDVLSEKINFSAPGGPKSTIFDTDDVDTLYFEVSIVSAPSDPPYMWKNGKMCYFYHFFGSQKKNIHPKYGSTVKNLTLTFLPQIFLGVSIYVEGPTFHRGTSKVTVTVTITVTVTVTRVPRTFQEWAKIWKIIFFLLFS